MNVTQIRPKEKSNKVTGKVSNKMNTKAGTILDWGTLSNHPSVHYNS